MTGTQGTTGEAARNQPSLLLIDDEPTIRSALSRYFTRRGWRVAEAENGRAALDILHAASAGTEAFDVILSDLKMPGFSGIELHDQLASERPDLLRRIIFSTGDVASDDASAFISRTNCVVLQKPFELAALAEVVERVRAG